MKEMRKIEMTNLPISGLVAKYTSLYNTCHHKIHVIVKYMSSQNTDHYKIKSSHNMVNVI
jgi:hypothetical protein